MKKINKYAKEAATDLFFVSNLCMMFVPFSSTLWVKRLSRKQGARLRNFWLKMWIDINSWGVRNIPGVKLNVEGIENVPEDASFLILSDHHSWTDIWTIFRAFIKWGPRYSAKAALFNIPVLGWAMRGFSHIPLKRGDERPTQNWIVTIAEAFYGKSKLLDRFVKSISHISMDDFRQKMLYRQIAKAQVRDMGAIQNALKDLDEEGLPFSIVVFIPGTRWMKEKWEKARENGKPGTCFANTLPPKAGALTQLLKLLYGRLDGVALVNIAYTHHGGKRKLDSRTKLFRTFAQGDLQEANMYIEWIPISQLPELKGDMKAEAYYREVKYWLLEVWQRVDDRLGNFVKTGSFENTGEAAAEDDAQRHIKKTAIR